jgi:molecular chaperone GrpE
MKKENQEKLKADEIVDKVVEEQVSEESVAAEPVVAEPTNMEEKYLRALADYQNLLKQTAKDREEFVKYALSDFLQDILPVYDHLKLSVNGLSEAEGSSPWAIGVQHVLKQFKDILEARGIEEIKTVGEKFDHNTMEAIDGTGDIVEKEIMPGYKLNGRVVKPARVIVN